MMLVVGGRCGNRRPNKERGHLLLATPASHRYIVLECIRNSSCCSCFYCSCQTNCGWRYLEIEKSNWRSAVGKMTKFGRQIQICHYLESEKI